MATHHTAMVVTIEQVSRRHWRATCDALPDWVWDVQTDTESAALWIAAARAHEEKARRLLALAHAVVTASPLASET